MEPFIAPIISIILIVIAIRTLLKNNMLKKQGIDAEGVVFDNTQSIGSNNIYPVIRFLTTEQEWITAAANTGTIPGIYKKGEKVSILYNKDNPKEFMIKSAATYIIPYILLTAGAGLFAYSIYQFII